MELNFGLVVLLLTPNKLEFLLQFFSYLISLWKTVINWFAKWELCFTQLNFSGGEIFQISKKGEFAHKITGLPSTVSIPDIETHEG